MEEILNRLTKPISEMTREEFDELPVREWKEEIGEFDSLVIIPQYLLHDSGYRCMAFVACYRDFAVCWIGGASDVIHVDGIGGYGERGIMQRLKFPHTLNKPLHPEGWWAVDCLKTSGYLRLFMVAGWGLKAGCSLSDFDVYSVPPSFSGGADQSNTKE